MKTIATLTLGSMLPSVVNWLNMHPYAIDTILGTVCGILLGALITALFVGPTPSPRHAPAKATVRKQTQRRIINSTAKQPAYVFVPTNYEWSAA
jgi:hypothetical protein